MDHQLTEEEVKEWLLHPTTQAFKKHLTSLREQLKEQWASGSFSQDSEFKNAMQQAKYIGQCQLLEDLLDVDSLTTPQE